jgi:DNA replication protein DnaC
MSAETPQILLAHHLKALKLPTFLREYDKLARQCAAEGVDHVRYLARLSELELIDRERRMVERRIRQARFPAVKSSSWNWRDANTSSVVRTSSGSATRAPARPTSPSVSASPPARKASPSALSQRPLWSTA